MRIWKMNDLDGWGNSLFFSNWENRRISGHISNPRIKVGDEIQSKMESGKIAKFKIKELDYQFDPSDQFFGTVEDVGYLDAP